MEKGIYLHSVGYLPPCYFYDPKDQEIILSRILDSGALLSLRQQGRIQENGFNGADLISLCDYDKRFEYNGLRSKYNGYNQYAIESLSIVFDKEKVEQEVEIIKPELVNRLPNTMHGFTIMNDYGNSGDSYSDLPDEVFVRDRLSLDGMTSLTFPTRVFNSLYMFRSKSKRIQLLKDEINRLKDILDIRGYYNIGIYDIESFDEMTDEFIERKICKKRGL